MVTDVPQVAAPEAADEGYCLEAQVGFLLRRAHQRHTAIFAEGMPHHLTPTQFAALVKLADEGGCSQNRLGRLTAMDVATIKGVVDRLRERRLVQAMPDPHDRRRTLLHLSEDGTRLLDDARRAGRRITERTLEPLSPRDRAALLRCLEKIAG